MVEPFLLIRGLKPTAWAIENGNGKMLGTGYFSDAMPNHVLGCPFAAFLTRSEARTALKKLKARFRRPRIRKARVVQVEFAFRRVS